MSEPKKRQLSLSEREEKILEFWEKNRIFEKSVRQRKGVRLPKGHGKNFVFYEGPPYANGRPGIHHVETRAFKDIILRYKTMKGFYVPRRAGWDTHGLPTEMEVEKKLGIKSKKEIEEKIGIEKFVEEARKNVFLYKEEWEKLTRRIGYWLDLDNPYITMTNDYIAKLWRIIKEIHKRGLLYEDYKVLPWCPRCETALSSHELSQGYKKITEKSITIKFELADEPKTYVLVWTTTPWTLPGNVALAVNPNIEYIKFSLKNYPDISDGNYIASKKNFDDCKEKIKTNKSRGAVVKIKAKMKGKDLIGKKYKALYPNDAPYKIVGADFVSSDEGTGIVHIAPAFGEDDMKTAKKNHLPVLTTVGEDGKMLAEGQLWNNVFIKDADNDVIEDLKKRGLLFATEEYEHDYPFCWRCQSPLMYYARNSWWFKTSAVKEKMFKENAKVNWYPEYLKEGRFGEWLKELRDWAISRERYWGAPLPIWKCEKRVHLKLVGGINELKKYSLSDKLNLYIMRHGESRHNKRNFSNGEIKKNHVGLTKQGVEQVKSAALKIKKAGVKIDLIIASDFLRTKQTAEIVKDALGIREIVFDKRLREIKVGIFEGKKSSEYHKYYSSLLEKFYKAPPKGESLRDVKRRSADFLKDILKKYKNKNILIVGHEYPLWMLSGAALGMSDREIADLKLKINPVRNTNFQDSIKIHSEKSIGGKISKEIKEKDFIDLAEFRKLKYFNLPLNREGDLDLHRPYIDDIKLKCEKCEGVMNRVLEVADVWFDSGAMPIASLKLNIKNDRFKIKELIKKNYPADYVCEAIDQTRGWFYTLLAVSSLLGLKAPYKNVVSAGLVLDEKGQKMSKSRGNVVNPWEMINKYGADAVRWYFYTVNQPWDDKMFKEKDVLDASRRFIGILWNSFMYWETYNTNSKIDNQNAKLQFKIQNLKLVINKWLVIRFNQLVEEVEKLLDDYDIVSAARKIEEFVIEDISHWYIRRVRDLMKKSESNEAKEASAVFGKVLLDFSKLLAPFAPFISEEIYLRISGQMRTGAAFFRIRQIAENAGQNKSVHLENFPKSRKSQAASRKLIKEMREVRRIVSLGLEARVKAGIKVRQPLASLKLRAASYKLQADLLDLIKGEINVKEIIYDKNIQNELELDTNITPELKEEGFLREVVRSIQDFRKKSGLTPKDRPKLLVQANKEGEKFIEKRGEQIKKETLLSGIELVERLPQDIHCNSVKQDNIEISLSRFKSIGCDIHTRSMVNFDNEQKNQVEL